MRTSNRLGCLTGTGLITALLTALVIAGYAYARGGLLYSPGPLNAQPGEILGGVASHAQIGGDCKACHTAPWEAAVMTDRCAVCHTNIAAQMKEVASMHGTLLHDNPQLGCRHCHPEHRGAEAALTDMNDAAFPHEVVGFSLNGHQLTAAREPFTCHDCHTKDISTVDLDTCDACHRQIDTAFMTAHALSYGTACLECHDGVDRLGNNFDHNSFSFKLRGKHAGPSCDQCHFTARAYADFKVTPQDCYSCHQKDEPHEGRFGASCADCHNEDGWLPAKFDHNLSVFKLEGRHQEVACESCHRSNVFKGTSTDCYSCHQQDDEHNGQFGSDCSTCHNPSSWEAVDFDHNRSNFPLTGSHAGVACESCHVNGQFKGLSTTCFSCHAEPAFHAGQFGTDCAACHTTSAWTPAEFNGKHTFPLNHGGGASCATCHPSSFTAYTCYGCHEHNEAEVASKHLEEGVGNFQNCMECHPTGQEHEGDGDRD